MAETTTKKHPIRAALYGFILGLGVAVLLTFVYPVIALETASSVATQWVIVVVVVMIISAVRGPFGPAKAPKGPAPVTAGSPPPAADGPPAAESAPEANGGMEPFSAAVCLAPHALRPKMMKLSHNLSSLVGKR
jgi:hypothetical protein